MGNVLNIQVIIIDSIIKMFQNFHFQQSINVTDLATAFEQFCLSAGLFGEDQTSMGWPIINIIAVVRSEVIYHVCGLTRLRARTARLLQSSLVGAS